MKFSKPLSWNRPEIKEDDDLMKFFCLALLAEWYLSCLETKNILIFVGVQLSDVSMGCACQ
jgi:hypothetical protein